MTAPDDAPQGRWSGLTRQELIAFGRKAVIDRLQEIGCQVDSGDRSGTA